MSTPSTSSTTATSLPAPDSSRRAAPSGSPGFLRLCALHVRMQVTETIRIPIAVISAALFPALAALFFVVPNSQVSAVPVIATASIAQLGVFGIMSACLFTHGTGVAEDRQLPFDGFVRTLPAGAAPRLIGRVVNGLIFSAIALVPLVAVGAFLTEAAISLPRLLASIGVALAVAVPFTLLGLAIGYSLPAKAAVAVVQVTLFPLAFAGGLFLPPEMFPDGWTPSRWRCPPARPASSWWSRAPGMRATPWPCPCSWCGRRCSRRSRCGRTGATRAAGSAEALPSQPA